MAQRTQILDNAQLAHEYWSQRLKIKYVQMGDLPSKFFFRRMRQRQRQKHIYFLRNNDGIWVEDQKEINHLILHHFQQLYTAQQSPAINDPQHSEDIDLVLRELDPQQITSVDKRSLLAPFLPSEVHTAIMDIANDKSPGVDGFSSAYFKIH